MVQKSMIFIAFALASLVTFGEGRRIKRVTTGKTNKHNSARTAAAEVKKVDAPAVKAASAQAQKAAAAVVKGVEAEAQRVAAAEVVRHLQLGATEEEVTEADKKEGEKAALLEADADTKEGEMAALLEEDVTEDEEDADAQKGEVAQEMGEAEAAQAAVGAEAAVAEQTGKAKLDADGPSTGSQVQGLAALLRSLELENHLADAEAWCLKQGAESVADLKDETWAEQLAEELKLLPIPRGKLVNAIRAPAVASDVAVAPAVAVGVPVAVLALRVEVAEPMDAGRAECLTKAFTDACLGSRTDPAVKDLSPNNVILHMKMLLDVAREPEWNLQQRAELLRKILKHAMKAAPDQAPTFVAAVDAPAGGLCGPGPSCSWHAMYACQTGTAIQCDISDLG